MLSILTLSIIAFASYFYIIGFWYLGLLPFLIFLIFFVYYIGGVSFKNKNNSLLQSYGLLIARFISLLGVFLILKFFGLETPISIIFIIIVNIVFWLFSYIFRYRDGQFIFQIAYYVFISILSIYSLVTQDFNTSFVVFSYLRILTLSLVGFLVFVWSLYFKVEDYLKYVFLMLAIGAIGIVLYKQINNIYIFLSISVCLLAILYTYIYYTLSHKPPTESQAKEVSVRRILAGERVLKDNLQTKAIFQKKYFFVKNFPSFIQRGLEFFNTLIILILIFLYFQNTLSLKGNINQFFYRFVIAGFIVNVYLLKKINYTSILQRFLTFLVINFAIYLSLFSAFNQDIVTIAFLGIIWNIFSSMMVFHIHKTKIGKYLIKVDYLFWIFATILALILNIILLFNTDIVSQLLFPLILLYVGIQGIMLYYSIKYINKIQEVEESDEIIFS